MATGGADDSMDSRTTCSICFEPYKGRSPKLLPCFHTFCLPCLVTLRDKALREATKVEGHVQDDCCGGDASNVKDTSTGLSIICPTCRKPNPIPLGGVAQFQTNFYLDGDGASDSAVDAAEDQGPSAVVRTAQDQLRVMEAVKARLTGEKLEVEKQMRAVETDIHNRYTLAVNCAAEARNQCSSSLKAAGLAIQDKLEAKIMLAENMRSKLSHFLSEQNSQQQPCPTEGESVLLTDAAMRHFRASAEKRAEPTFFTYHPEESVQTLEGSLDEFMGRVVLFGQLPLHSPKIKPRAREVDRADGNRDTELLQRCKEISQAESLKLRQELDSVRTDNEWLKAEFEAIQRENQKDTSTRLNHTADLTELRTELAALKTAVETDLSKFKQEADYARLSSDLAALQKAVQAGTSKLKQDVATLHKDCAKLVADLAAAEKNIGQIKSETECLDIQVSGAAWQKVTSTVIVAFHAELVNNVTTNSRRTLYMKDVISNIGGAYKAFSGVFTAPVTGTYIFMATTSPYEEGKVSRLDMCLEEDVIAYAVAYGMSSATCHTAVRVVKGQRVCLKSYGEEQYTFCGGGCTGFSGILVQEEL